MCQQTLYQPSLIHLYRRLIDSASATLSRQEHCLKSFVVELWMKRLCSSADLELSRLSAKLEADFESYPRWKTALTLQA